MRRLVILCVLIGSLAASFPAGAASSFAVPVFADVWDRGEAIAPNFWGPLETARNGEQERYAEAPGGLRLVQYFDKARMELTVPATGVVTNGLLAVELISGRLQVGDNTFQQGTPAGVPVAGDPNNAGPTYAQIGASGLLTAVPAAVGTPTTRALTAAGTIGTFPAGGGDPNGAISAYDAATRHNVPKAFAEYRDRAGLLTIGLAISEPFWANGVLVGGVPKDVLVQAFERRVLTYTPTNPPAFRVEMGNIGRQYFRWRYPNRP